MSELALRVREVTKSYRITRTPRHDTLREAIASTWRRRAGADHPEPSRHRSGSAFSELFWALNGVSFDVARGDVFGIIGRNGAGKSTLLKILSRITRPTTGFVELNGRVGSLLEVGTGFHPELTGRENVFLNGAILGMRRADILRKFDEIVAFAEVERFLDIPVKRYSSGMYTRLAFAVAAHLNSEILIVDEVLAVGDAQFQKKCLGKMGEAAEGGRTVLFVSHNMSAITRLCGKVVWLDAGQIRGIGRTADLVKEYLADAVSEAAERRWVFPGDAPGDDRVRLVSARVVQQGKSTSLVDINVPMQIELEFVILCDARNLVLGVNFRDPTGLCLFQSSDWRPNRLAPGRYRSSVTVPAYLLAEGRVSILIGLVFMDPLRRTVIPSALSFEAVDSADPLAVRGPHDAAWPGVVRPRLEWTQPAQLPADGTQQPL